MSEYELLKAQLRPLSWSDIDARFGVPMDQTMRKAAAAIETLEAKLAICEKYRDAYAECDRIGTQAVRDLEAKLAKAHEKEIAVWSENYAAMERKLYAARADTKLVKAYAEELRVMNKNQEAMIRQADRRGDALETKLAKVLNHIRKMQGYIQEYLEPGSYVAKHGNGGTFSEPHPHQDEAYAYFMRQQMREAVLNDLIHMLDGP
jgi:outer membrane murein-binding lipoprotein Lpp